MYKIMFVDDEEQNLFLMEKIIDWEENGFRVCGIALDGPEGIQVFEETEPDVVFVDIRMDEMDGLEMIEKLQQRKKKAVYVIVTAYDEFSYAKKAISLGVKDYLLKPVSRKELLDMVRQIREELDTERKKEDDSRFLSRQYENGIFEKVFAALETGCLEKRDISAMPEPNAAKPRSDTAILKSNAAEPDSKIPRADTAAQELDSVIRGRALRSYEMYSPTEEPGDLLHLVEDWEIEYCFPGYDCVCMISAEEKKEAVLEAFEDLKSHHIRKKYILQVNRTFSNAEELIRGYCVDFRRRGYCFYERQSRVFFCSEAKAGEGQAYLSYEEEGEKPLRRLIYNGAAEEAVTLVRQMAEYAGAQGSAPGGLADEMIGLLFLVKNELTKLYKDRAFLILRHQNVWDLHKLRTETKLVSRMEELLRETGTAVKNMIENKGNYSLMGRTAEYIRAHFADPEFSAGEVAETVHLSRNYFLKVFKEEMGIAFLDYVTGMRMEKAKQMLKETEETVYAVSRAVGYESQYHFSRKFKQLYGISPNEYRSL